MKVQTFDHGWWLDSRGRRHTEWHAIDADTYDGAPDSHHPVGVGSTEADAVADLHEQIAEREEERDERLAAEHERQMAARDLPEMEP